MCFHNCIKDKTKINEAKVHLTYGTKGIIINEDNKKDRKYVVEMNL